MDISNIIEFIKKRWFHILILLGIFILLWRPQANISVPVSSADNKSTSSWFKDRIVSTDIVGGTSTPMNTMSTSEEIVVDAIPKLNNGKLTDEEMEKNKQLIIGETTRREPELIQPSWSLFDQNKTPTIGYVLKTLEEKYGTEYLYSNVSRAVALVMKTIGE